MSNTDKKENTNVVGQVVAIVAVLAISLGGLAYVNTTAPVEANPDTPAFVPSFEPLGS